MYNYLPLVCVLLFNFFCCGEDSLLSVVVVFRHGARTPIDPYPTDPYRNASYWPVGFGQLTDEGKRQELELGQWLRRRYADFMPAKYSEKDIYVLSTDVDRTLMSAEAVLAGFFPPQTDFYSNLAWQPIPVHTQKEERDELLAMKRPCPKYDQLFRDLSKDPFFQNISQNNQELFEYLTKYTGTSVNNIDNLEYIYNTLTIESNNNLTLPPWTGKVFPKKLEYLASLSFALDTYTPELARLKTGVFFNLLTNHFKNVAEASLGHHNHSKDDPWQRKFLIFSGHDTTIANILNSMGLFDLHSPPFASTILFELRQSSNNSTYLNLFYKNSTNPMQLCLKGCDLDCDIVKFVTILKPITLNSQDWMEACTLNWFDFLPFGYRGNIVAISMFLGLSLTVCGLLTASSCLKTRKKPNKALYEPLTSEDA